MLEALGLTVNRLIRLAYGPFQLGDLPVGGVEEIGPRVIREQLSQWIAPDKLPVGNATAKPVAGSVQQGRRGGVGPAVLPEAAPPKAYKPGWARGPSRFVMEDQAWKHVAAPGSIRAD